MMRASLFLAVIVLGAAQTPGPVTPGPDMNKAWCAFNGLAVADELMNSIVWIWQGVHRCGTGHKKAECSVDVSYAIQAVTNMINTINKAVNGCGAIMDGRAQCGIAIGEVTAAMAGVAGASSAIAEDCPKSSLQPVQHLGEAMSGTGGNFPHNLAVCIVDAKKLFFTVIRASAHIADASEKCNTAGHASDCADAVIRTTVSVAAMGEFIAGVVGTCTKPDNRVAKCASDVLGLLRNLGGMSAAGQLMDDHCGPTAAERLYLEEGRGKKGEKAETYENNLPTFALAILLPITAVMSFVAGRRMAKSQRMPAFDAEAAEDLMQEE